MRAVELKWLERVAYHEAGHAVAAVTQGISFPGVSIVPRGGMTRNLRRGDFGFTFQPNGDAGIKSRKKIEAEIIVAFAGPAAEAKAGGRRNLVAARGDLANSRKLAARVCASDDEVVAYVEWLAIRANKLITGRPHWRAVEALAAALMKEQEISAAEAKKLINRELAAK